MSFDFFYIAKKYFENSLCLEIRCTTDNSPDVISLKGILDSMYIHNEFYTYERALESVGKDAVHKEGYGKIWSKFTSSENRGYISKKAILKRTQKLLNVTKPVILYTNKNLSHISVKKQSKKEEATYRDLWVAANYILNLLKEMNSLLNYVCQIYSVTYQYDHYKHLRIPWWNEKFSPKTDLGGDEKFSHWNKF